MLPLRNAHKVKALPESYLIQSNSKFIHQELVPSEFVHPDLVSKETNKLKTCIAQIHIFQRCMDSIWKNSSSWIL